MGLASMTGSLLGSCSCFLLGRYIMRDRVRKWGRKYPLFDAVDSAVSDNGLKIMGLLYLSPVLPLGPVSYLMGTTSMPLFHFASAKIACLPLMMLYVFLVASTDTFFGSSDSTTTKKMGVDDETHRKMVMFGLVLSALCMTIISHVVKKELNKIFDRQKKEKSEKDGDGEGECNQSINGDVELTGRSDDIKLSRRPRGHADGDNV